MSVIITAESYPLEGTVTGFQAEELTSYGWVQVFNGAPGASTSFSVDPTSTSNQFRVRWIVDGHETAWKEPVSVSPALSAVQEEAVKAAIIVRATRNLQWNGAAFGRFGSSDGTNIVARPDFASNELLFGVRYRNWDVDLTTLVTTDDVIRAMGQEPGDFPDANLAEVQLAIDTACSQIASELRGVPFA